MRPSEYIEAEALIKEMDGRIEFRTKLLAKSDEVMRAKHQGAILAYETVKKSIRELQMYGRNERG